MMITNRPKSIEHLSNLIEKIDASQRLEKELRELCKKYNLDLEILIEYHEYPNEIASSYVKAIVQSRIAEKIIAKTKVDNGPGENCIYELKIKCFKKTIDGVLEFIGLLTDKNKTIERINSIKSCAGLQIFVNDIKCFISYDESRRFHLKKDKQILIWGKITIKHFIDKDIEISQYITIPESFSSEEEDQARATLEEPFIEEARNELINGVDEWCKKNISLYITRRRTNQSP